MTRLRATIARRLKDAQNTAAMLTTYNEVDMSGIMSLRNEYKDAFEKKHKVKLGFMSFFVKACTHALKEVPEVNAEIDGQDVVYKNFVHMGVAVGTPTGLVVPIVRDADQKSFAQIEKEIGELGARVVLVDGQPVLYLERGNKGVITFGETPDRRVLETAVGIDPVCSVAAVAIPDVADATSAGAVARVTAVVTAAAARTRR